MVKLTPAVLLVMGCSCLPGCMGTIGSRASPCGPRLLGWPVYSGVTYDWNHVADGAPDAGDDRPVMYSLLAFVSFPLDLVLDTALLFPDLCAGALGYRKVGYPPAHEAATTSRAAAQPDTTQQPTSAPSSARG